MNGYAYLLPPAFGFVIGFGTNALAIRMLFRPYREYRVLGLRFQGMVPRRQAEIARTVAATVATELLREERVAERLAGPEVRAALEGLAVDLLDRYVAGAPTLAEALGPDRCEPARRVLEAAVREAARAAAGWIGTGDGGAFVASVVAGVLERTPAELFPGEERLAARIASGKVVELLAGADLEQRVRRGLDGLAVRLAGMDRPLADLVPGEVRQALRDAAVAAVPSLLSRFETVLLAPANVDRIKAAVREGITAYLSEPRGGRLRTLVRHAALLARDRIFRESDEIVDANLHRLRELVHGDENRRRLEEGIAAAVDEMLSRTPGDLFASVPPETLDAVYDRVSAWVCSRLSRPAVGEAVARVAERELERAFGTPLAELVALADPDAPERLGRDLAGWAAGGGLEALADREAGRLAGAVLHLRRPAGGRFLPDPLVREVVGLAADRLLPVVADRIPEILRAVDVQGLVEREIRAFSPADVERVILSVSRRELRAITWWGGVLGAAVGVFQSALAWWGG